MLHYILTARWRRVVLALAFIDIALLCCYTLLVMCGFAAPVSHMPFFMAPLVPLGWFASMLAVPLLMLCAAPKKAGRRFRLACIGVFAAFCLCSLALFGVNFLFLHRATGDLGAFLHRVLF